MDFLMLIFTLPYIILGHLNIYQSENNYIHLRKTPQQFFSSKLLKAVIFILNYQVSSLEE